MLWLRMWTRSMFCWNTAARRYMPVSYTHLDVYKRQEKTLARVKQAIQKLS